MKKTSVLLGLLVIRFANAQEGRVGINTDAPKATLHIKSIENDKSKGILIPTQTGDELKTNSANLGEEQDGVISYITAGATTPNGAGANVHFKGLHRFNHDNASWTRLEPSGLEKVRHKVGTTEKIGYRLVGTNPAHYTGLGNNAIDFSIGNNGGGAIGDYSIVLAQGENIRPFKATGEYSIVLGNGVNFFGLSGTDAKGKYSVVIGGGVANGENSLAMIGGQTSGNNAIAIGGYSGASGEYATAIGYSAIAEGEYTVAFNQSKATAEGAFAASGGNALGIASVAFLGKAINRGEIAFGASNLNTDKNAFDKWEYKEDDKRAQLFSIGSKYLAGKDSGGGVSGSEGNALVVLRNAYTGIGIIGDQQEPSNSKPTEMLDVNGNVRVRGQSETLDNAIKEGEDCANLGTITFSRDGNFYGCIGTGKWKKLNND